MNHCLLLKFIHKLHENDPLPWKCWFISHAGNDFSGNPDSYLPKLVLVELPRYRSLTKVQIDDSARVSFQHDRWLLGTSLAESFPALYSHHTNDTITVQMVMVCGPRQQLPPRLTCAADAEFVVITDCLSHVTQQDEPGVRMLATATMEPFTMRRAYHTLHASAVVLDIVRIWVVRLPAKVKFFAWLWHHGRLKTRAHLFHRNIKPREDSRFEHCSGTLETDAHIFYECPKAQAVWNRLQFTIQESTLRRPWDFALAFSLPEATRVNMMLLVLWHIWKA
jgi:hypothetical protein